MSSYEATSTRFKIIKPRTSQVERDILFLSSRLTETRHRSNELERLALVGALAKLHIYLLARHFRVYTDDSALKWPTAKKAVPRSWFRVGTGWQTYCGCLTSGKMMRTVLT